MAHTRQKNLEPGTEKSAEPDDSAAAGPGATAEARRLGAGAFDPLEPPGASSAAAGLLTAAWRAPLGAPRCSAIRT